MDGKVSEVVGKVSAVAGNLYSTNGGPVDPRLTSVSPFL